jgi:hypothetical protein
MALSKSINTTMGIAASYHVVTNPKINPNGSGTVLVKSYLNETAFNEGKKELYNKQHNIPANTFTTLANAITDVQTYLKTTQEFTGATDV